MAKNKVSVWAIIILVATIIALALLVFSIVTTALGIPGVIEAAKQEAANQGLAEDEAVVVANLAIVGVIIALVLGSIFDILKIIGGFMFSLKGRWGIFCIIVSVISLALDIWSLISDIQNKVGVASIIGASIGLAISLLLCVACFKHRAEIR